MHLICVCSQPICQPDIDVVTGGVSELGSCADLWLEELLDHLKEEGKLEIQDPRRVLKVMTEFCDKEPEVQILGEDSVFKPQSCLARNASFPTET